MNRRGFMHPIVVIFIGVLVIAVLLLGFLVPGPQTGTATITQMNSYGGGTTYPLTYYNLTLSFQGQIYHQTVNCNLYSQGQRVPFIVSEWYYVRGGWSITHLPEGC